MQSYSGCFFRGPIKDYQGSEKLILCYHDSKLVLYSKYSRSLDVVHIPQEFIFIDEEQDIKIVGKNGKFRINKHKSQPDRIKYEIIENASENSESKDLYKEEMSDLYIPHNDRKDQSDDLPDFIPLKNNKYVDRNFQTKYGNPKDNVWKWESLDN